MPGQPHTDPYYRGVDARSDPANMMPISEAEFQEIMERNKTVSSSAIARAVQDASAGWLIHLYISASIDFTAFFQATLLQLLKP